MDTQRDNTATPPDRLNEDWRFGRPHVYAAELLQLLAEQPGDAGCTRLSGPGAEDALAAAPTLPAIPAIGSGYVVQQALAKHPQTTRLRLTHSSTAEQPLRISCEARGLYLPVLDITITPGTHAHIVEEHIHHSPAAALLCLRRYTVLPGASLALELREQGNGHSRALNITHLTCVGNSAARQLTTHSGHTWAREETTAELVAEQGAAPDLLLLSANRLQGQQVLDQRTLQRHTTPGAKSRLLYKNVVDDRATAIFGGNIRVELAAHDTDAYLSNLNMMLNEHATVHSLPGLEILADRVRCSHGSASAPMDPEQLFYLLSRGIDAPAARTLIADGFLADVHSQFQA